MHKHARTHVHFTVISQPSGGKKKDCTHTEGYFTPTDTANGWAVKLWMAAVWSLIVVGRTRSRCRSRRSNIFLLHALLSSATLLFVLLTTLVAAEQHHDPTSVGCSNSEWKQHYYCFWRRHQGGGSTVVVVVSCSHVSISYRCMCVYLKWMDVVYTVCPVFTVMDIIKWW